MHYAVLEILLYNMRQVQCYTAQHSLTLRQQVDDAPEWVCRTKELEVTVSILLRQLTLQISAA